MPPVQCLVVGVDNHVGAYLARLLEARGIGNGGGLAGVGERRLLTLLGIAESVGSVTAADANEAAADARLVFAVNDGSAEQVDAFAAMIDTIASRPRPPRLVHVADVADLAQPGVRDTMRRLRAVRGIDAATVLLEAHDSRFGPPDTTMAQVIGAVARVDAQPVTIAETGARDWGWTPEYVDAVQRMAARDRLIDIVVASGHRLSVADIAEHAHGYFRRMVPIVSVTGVGTDASAIDTAPLLTATGWRATTFGRDLVRALCEGATDRGSPQ